MDILIKGMAMPKACITGELPNFLYCPCFDSCTIACGDAERPKNCQLVELPPHGRLVNLDDVYEAINREIVPKGVFLSDFYKAFADIPVVLERTT